MILGKAFHTIGPMYFTLFVSRSLLYCGISEEVFEKKSWNLVGVIRLDLAMEYWGYRLPRIFFSKPSRMTC